MCLSLRTGSSSDRILAVTRHCPLAACLILVLWGPNPLCRASVVQATLPVNSEETAQSHVGAGYKLIQAERYNEAASEFRAALGLDPQLVRTRYQLAVCLLALGQLSESRQEFERLARETSEDPSVIYYLGRLDLREGKVDSAIRKFRRVVSKPPFPDTAYYLGSAYLKKGAVAEAERWLKSAAQANPRDFRIPDHLARTYQRAGRREDAEKAYALSSQLRQRYSEASRHAVACSHALETQTFEEAQEPCKELLDRSDPDRLTILGMIYGQRGHYAAAVEPLARAAELDPESFEIQHNLGLTLFRLGRHNEARSPLERAVELRPDYFGSSALLGATLYVLKEDTRAYKVLDHAHQLNPQDPDTSQLLFNLSTILARKNLAAQDYDRALPYLERAAELRPQEAETHRQLAQIYERLGRTRKAAQERRAADELTGRQP